MTPERYAKVQELFDRAAEAAPAEREALLAGCDDPEVRRAVERLLEADAEADGFLESAAVDSSLFDDAFDAALDDAAHGGRAAEGDAALTPAGARGGPGASGAAPAARVCPRCGRRYEGDSDRFCSSDGSQLEPEGDALLGSILDRRYEVRELVGEGGMGRVYRAFHRFLGRDVAIKVLHGPRAATSDALERFRREGRALVALRHPHVVAVHDLWMEPDGRAYLVLDFVSGRTLRAVIERGPLALEPAVEIFGQVAEAVDTANRAGVVHRDIKPENVVVDEAGDASGGVHATVLDFGIAKLRAPEDGVPESTREAHTTAEGLVIGTPGYMAPEQWGLPMRDGATEIDGRADVYSLGVLLYEMLAGRRPFPSKVPRPPHPDDLASCVPLDRIGRDVPRGVSDAVRRALEWDRADRPESAGAMLAEVRKGVLEEGDELLEGNPLYQRDGDRYDASERRVAARPPPKPRAGDRPMLLETLRVPGTNGERRVEIFFGDLMDVSGKLDVLVVSVYPGSYWPTPASLLGSLARRGISLFQLSENKAADLRDLFSCWFSKRLRVTPQGPPPARRILCFEPPRTAPPAEHVGDIFRSLSAVVGGRIAIRTVAMPVVASGDQGGDPTTIVGPLLEGAIRWMEAGLPVDRLMIVERSRRNAAALIDAVEAMKPRLLAGIEPGSLEEHDVYLIRSPEDEPAARAVAEALERERPGVRVLDGPRPRRRGAAWPQGAYEAIAASRVVVPILGRGFERSRECVEELRLAQFRARRVLPLRIDDGRLAPGAAEEIARAIEGETPLAETQRRGEDQGSTGS